MYLLLHMENGLIFAVNIGHKFGFTEIRASRKLSMLSAFATKVGT